MSGPLLRIGQIVPSSNTTMETEVPAILRAREALYAERFTFHGSRMRMHRVTPEELAAMNREGLRCAAELADARVDVMSTACLVAIMAQGLGYHREVEADFRRVVAENGAASRVMTSAGALIHGLRHLGARKVSLMAPYMKPLTAKVVAYLEHEGIEVIDSLSFEIADNLEVGRRDPMQLLQDVRRLNTANADVVVLSACVQMPSLPALQLAQDRLGLPVTSTAACTARNMLDLLELPAGIPGYGAVLA
ncbi:MAG TPA: Asp/Glu racemase [Ramlibacter sp.]|nr:Asp/Glu racemase [Ramlibacter sp.]